MNKIELKKGRKVYKYRCPQNWEEIKPKQYRALGPYLLQDKIYSPDVLQILMRINPDILARMEAPALIPLYDTISFIKEPQVFPPFPFVKIWGRKYYLPGPRLENLSIVEFAFLDMALIVMQAMEEKKDAERFEEYLIRLCAYMARPKAQNLSLDPENFSGDIREVFNTSIIEKRLRRFKRIKPMDKFLMLHYFVGCKRYIQKRYQNPLFPKPLTEEGEVVIGVVRKAESPKQWLDTIRKLAGGKFGNLEETRRANLYDVLDELKDQIKASKRNQFN